MIKQTPTTKLLSTLLPVTHHLLLITCCLSLITAPPALAQTEVNIRDQFNDALPDFYLGGNLSTDGTGNALSGTVSAIVAIAIPLAALAVLLYFLWAGFNWMTAGGDKQKVEDARNRIINAVIGMAIVASAIAFSYIVNQFFGTNIQIEDAGL